MYEELAALEGGVVEPGAQVDPTARLQPPYRIEAGARIGPFAMVEGPAVVEAGAEIRHAGLVRGPAWISAGCVVGHGSEVARSVLLAGSSAAHFCFIADSLIGRDVNFGSHVVVSAVRLGGDLPLLETRRMEIVLGGEVHVTTSKVGAVVGDRCEVASGVQFAPASFLGRDCVVYPGVYVQGYYAPRRTLRVAPAARALFARPDLRPRVRLRPPREP